MFFFVLAVMMSFVVVATCLDHSFRLVTVHRSMNESCYNLKKTTRN